ncbi:2-hydroxy-3-keto-5-methylthiopentenyl-1-phosphate phosphatase [Caldalkalibacillus uzonensis]|uniref:2-hydroxy-3-keto-5-methylthiopentenyl-1-phosphate phosphatase n=1 Tax=Caldalkalibacillus uzonensis TaxID=353224 RepID=A0ABU0CNQ3_9BACI|nr:hypothetical protein [Caldalkalibacillus uzonensis]MDQ0337519.1 2-hydroxy-3-keto-5-methylthiopentenyl-1-phosphate phosphatase [Caldalkalibacillus uzonensis]
MKQLFHIDEVLDLIDQSLSNYHRDRDKMTSLTEHVHHQAAIDALLILKSQIKLRSRMS